MGDIWIKAEYPIGPFAQQPVEQAVADVLAKAPWAAWQTGEVAFRYDYIDRPEAGTALLALLPSPQRPAPNDGLRYAIPDSVERRTVTRHTVACPASIDTPTQNQPLQVELECYTSYQGHFPPTSREQTLAPNSPELRLTRFRKRWRLTNGQYPALWFFWWGRDETGGTGAGTSRSAPAGWDRTPVRAYPIVRDPNMPTAALYPFPGPSHRSSTNTSISNNGGGGGGGGAGGGTISTNTASRAEPLAALPSSAQAHAQGGGLDARQAYFAQQQQQHMLMQQQARARGLAPPAATSANHPLGYNLTPAQMQEAQLAAQQRFAAAQQQAGYASRAGSATAANPSAQTPPSRKPNLPATAAPAQRLPPSGSNTSLAPTSREPILDTPIPTVDVLDLVTSRQLAIHRLSSSQDSLAPIFDSWTTSEILGGTKRKREVDEAVRSEVAIDPRTGESRGGIAGFGREHTLTILGTSAARISVHAAMDKDFSKSTYTLEERKKKLEAMLERLEKETEIIEARRSEIIANAQNGPIGTRV